MIKFGYMSVMAGFLATAPLISQAQDAASKTEDSYYRYLGEFDVGYKYQFWEPDFIPDTYVQTTGLNILDIKWNLGQASWLADKPFISFFIPAIEYEFTPNASASQDRLVELVENDKDAWKKLTLNFDMDLSRVFFDAEKDGDHFFLSLDYNKQTFLTDVQSYKDYWFVTDDYVNLLIPGDVLSVATEFEEYRAGITLKHTQGGGFLLGMGVADITYNKPMATDVLSTVERIYEAELTATGIYVDLGMGTEYTQLLLNYTYALDADVQILDGVSVSHFDQDYGYYIDVTTIEYVQYGGKLTTNAKQFGLDIDLEASAEVIYRKFSDFIEEVEVNDDTIINFGIKYRFGL